MHILIDTTELNSCIQTVTKALATHSNLAIQEGIYIEAVGDQVLFKCTDLSLQIEEITQAEVLEEGGIVLPGRLLMEIARKLPGEKTDINTKKNTASIQSDRAKFSIQGDKTEDYHSMPQVKKEIAVRIPMGTLKKMIGQCIFATAQDDSKPILTGVLVELMEEDIHMIALDGYRLAMIKRSIHDGENRNAVIPAKSLSEIGRILEDREEEISIVFSRTHVLVDMGNTKIITRLLDGEFIKYKQILPSEHTLRVRVDRPELIQVIERVALVARDGKSNLIRFTFSENSLSISANSETGNAHEDMEVQTIGELMEIAFNAKYIGDVIKALDDEFVYLDFNNNISPCVVRPVHGDDYFYLILPVRLFS